MASNKYYYQVLGVQSNASQDEIKQAFHQLAHKYHPDISTEPNAAQKFQDINEAYTALRNQEPSDKKRSKLPIIAAIVGVISLVAIMIFFSQNSFNTQEIQAGILNRNSEAINSLENANINLAKKVISGTAVKVALIDFYLKNPPLWNKLDSYHHSIRSEILKDDQVYRRLRDYYYHQIDNEIKEDKFKKALPLLGELKKAYPKKSELFNKYQQIQEKKQQRLAALTQKYMDCLYKTWMPLLERTHCMAAARDTIETVGIEHELPIDSNLPAMYAKEVRLSLKDQNYDYADDILLDWEKLLPNNSSQRDVLKDILFLRRERENIVADLSGNDKMQIAKRLHQLSADPVLQQQVLEIGKVKNNILKYNFNELLTLIASNYEEITPSNESKLREILEIPEEVDDEDTTTQIASSSSTPIIIPTAIPIPSTTKEVKEEKAEEKAKEEKNNKKVDTLLTQCQRYYNKNYLTRGKHTALSCYRQVLNIEPSNNQALDGINNIEKKYYSWADNALRKKKFGRVKYYIQALQKFNSNSSRLTGLQEKLNAAQRQTVAQANEATKAKEAARLARRKASREKEIQEREARLKTAKEMAAKRRSARYKAAKERAAKEMASKERAARAKVAKIKAANAKAAKERAAKRKLARKNAAKERVARRKAANAKAAKERAAKRKLARQNAAKRKVAKRKVANAKAANQRAAKRKIARQNAAKERAAIRKVIKERLAKERAAKRKLARRQNAAKERAARRKAANAKAANQRAAKRKIARQNAAKERAAKRKIARQNSAKERVARRKAANAKAAKERAAKRKIARQNAANQRAAKRKIARQNAAKERVAKRKAANAKAANQRAAKRKAAARAKAANQRVAKRKAAARAKAANQRAAKRKAAARAKAANQRAAKRKAAARTKAAKRKAAARTKAANQRAAKRKAAARAKAAKERSAKRRKAARERAIKAKAAKRKAAKKKAAKRKRIAKRKRGRSCSRLVKQMSIGVKPLTRGQRAYFSRKCR